MIGFEIITNKQEYQDQVERKQAQNKYLKLVTPDKSGQTHPINLSDINEYSKNHLASALLYNIILSQKTIYQHIK